MIRHRGQLCGSKRGRRRRWARLCDSWPTWGPVWQGRRGRLLRWRQRSEREEGGGGKGWYRVGKGYRVAQRRLLLLLRRKRKSPPKGKLVELVVVGKRKGKVEKVDEIYKILR